MVVSPQPNNLFSHFFSKSHLHTQNLPLTIIFLSHFLLSNTLPPSNISIYVTNQTLLPWTLTISPTTTTKIRTRKQPPRRSNKPTKWAVAAPTSAYFANEGSQRLKLSAVTWTSTAKTVWKPSLILPIIIPPSPNPSPTIQLSAQPRH